MFNEYLNNFAKQFIKIPFYELKIRKNLIKLLRVDIKGVQVREITVKTDTKGLYIVDV